MVRLGRAGTALSLSARHRRALAVNVPNPLPTADGLLAATAMAHELTFVTRNVKGVAPSGARTLNPFSL